MHIYGQAEHGRARHGIVPLHPADHQLEVDRFVGASLDRQGEDAGFGGRILAHFHVVGDLVGLDGLGMGGREGRERDRGRAPDGAAQRGSSVTPHSVIPSCPDRASGFPPLNA